MTLDIVPVQSERRMLVGEEIRLRFRLFDSDSGRTPAEMGPLRVLVYQPTGARRGHGWARPIGGGHYEVAFPVPGEGPYYLFFSCPKSRVGFGQLPYLVLRAPEAGAPEVTRASESAPAVHQC